MIKNSQVEQKWRFALPDNANSPGLSAFLTHIDKLCYGQAANTEQFYERK